jgi:hypothetical protein
MLQRSGNRAHGERRTHVCLRTARAGQEGTGGGGSSAAPDGCTRPRPQRSCLARASSFPRHATCLHHVQIAPAMCMGFRASGASINMGTLLPKHQHARSIKRHAMDGTARVVNGAKARSIGRTRRWSGPITFCDADDCAPCSLVEGDPDCLRRKADLCLWLAARSPRSRCWCRT